MPDVSERIDDFADKWWDWYISLQPESRVSYKESEGTSLTDDVPQDSDGSAWCEIRKGGPNGIFLLLLTLGWWGVGASDQIEAQTDEIEGQTSTWSKAFNDLGWVLESLLEIDDHAYQDEESISEGIEKEDSSVPTKRGLDSAGSSRSANKRYIHCCVSLIHSIDQSFFSERVRLDSNSHSNLNCCHHL